MNFTKLIIAIMSVLIVVCLGLVIYGITRTKSTETPEVIASNSLPETLILPHDAKIKNVIAVGNQLVLHVTVNHMTSFYIINGKTGQHIATTSILYQTNTPTASRIDHP